MKKKRLPNWVIACETLRERLKENVIWYPLPALISFCLVLLLSGHLLPGLNARLGNKSDVINFIAEREPEGAIWLGIYPDNENIVVVTSDRNYFSWPIAGPTQKQTERFSYYLAKKLQKIALTSAMQMETALIKTSVVLAVDQHLKYFHLHPILDTLARNGITRYGFETRMVN